MGESSVEEHHSSEILEARSSKKSAGQEPLDYKTWASTRFCIPDDCRFRFPFSRTGLEYLFSTGRKAKAEEITQSIHDLFSNEAKKGNDELHFTCADYYEGIDGETRMESIYFSTAGGLVRDSPVPFAEVKGEDKTKFQRFIQVLGLDFTENAYQLFPWKSEFEESLPNTFGTQTRPSYTTLYCGGSNWNCQFTFKRASFGLIWYTCGVGNVQFSNLNHGPLYGSAGRMQLVQKRIEIIGIENRIERRQTTEPNDGKEPAHVSPWQRVLSGERNWTIIVSSPPRSWIGASILSHDLNFGVALVTVVHNLVGSALREWEAIVDYFDSLLAEGQHICSPKDHDKLLVDDENLTRSRKYFWLMTSIDEFSVLLNQTVQALEQLYNENIPPKKDRTDPLVRAMLDEFSWQHTDSMHELFVTRCKNLLERLEEQRRRTEVFRNGLFNASSVIESRLASRLSENVMLLTYVSIFYIPLGFISSLWAVPNTLLKSDQLAYVMVVVGIATYMITFNINTMSRLWIQFYNQRRDRIVESMKQDAKCKTTSKQDVLFWDHEATKQEKTGSEIHLKQKTKWSSRAARFEDTFHIVREKAKPSDWILFAYLVRHTGLAIFRPVRAVSDSIRMVTSRYYRFWKGLLASNKSSDDKKDESAAEKGLGSPSGGPGEQTTANGGPSTDTDDAVPNADGDEVDFYTLMDENEELALALRLSTLQEDSLQEARAREETLQQSANLGTLHEDRGSPAFLKTRLSVSSEANSRQKDKSLLP